MKRLSGSVFAVLLALAPAAQAQNVIASYTAVISPQDRVNSSGAPLQRIYQILAQDRANYHRFGIRQPGDEADPVFGDQQARAQISTLLSRGNMTPEARASITSGASTSVRVTIYGNGAEPQSLSVALVEPSAGNASPLSSSQGRGGWQYGSEAGDRLGVARVSVSDDSRIALECVRPGTEGGMLEGVATAGLHQPESLITLVSAGALGLPATTPHGVVRNVALSVDGQEVGVAPMLYMAGSGDLAMNIPGTHPVLEQLRSGTRLELTDTASGARAGVPLTDSDAAIGALLEFCATPLSPQTVASLPGMAQQAAPAPDPAPAQTETGPAVAPATPPSQEAAAASSAPAGPRCETVKSGWRTEVQCFDADGAKAPGRTTTAARVQYGLQLIGCPVPRLTGDLSDSPEASTCFNEMFDIEGQSLTPKAESALQSAADWGDREKVMEILLQRGFDPNAQAKREAAAKDFITTPDHPGQALFEHPGNRASFLGVVTDLGRWSSSRYVKHSVQTRWGDASRFDGRTFSLVDEDAPRFLVMFGQSEAEVTAYVDGELSTYAAPYHEQNGLQCALLSDFYEDQCLSLILANIPGGPNATWTMHGSLMIVQNGWPVPIGFGTATEGRQAFDAAVAAREQSDTAVSAALATGRELDALPVDGIAGPAGLAASLYEDSSSVSLEPYLAQRLPFLSYHRAYAVACDGTFHRPSKEYRVIGTRLAEFSYIPFNKYEIWESYVADKFPVLSEAYDDFSRGMDELVPSLMREASDPMADRILMADRMLTMDRQFNSWAVFHSGLLDRIGCSGPTVKRYEKALAENYKRRKPI